MGYQSVVRCLETKYMADEFARQGTFEASAAFAKLTFKHLGSYFINTPEELFRVDISYLLNYILLLPFREKSFKWKHNGH